jgi:hypothetical protein
MIHAEKKHARPQSSSVTQHGAVTRISSFHGSRAEHRRSHRRINSRASSSIAFRKSLLPGTSSSSLTTFSSVSASTWRRRAFAISRMASLDADMFSRLRLPAFRSNVFGEGCVPCRSANKRKAPPSPAGQVISRETTMSYPKLAGADVTAISRCCHEGDRIAAVAPDVDRISVVAPASKLLTVQLVRRAIIPW